ncbi:MAG: hypothetical protein CME62_09040 [Halobacteriovoraceae bacterium]|nr:hypothetical protein [Halobacteriovoraceae bacterium]
MNLKIRLSLFIFLFASFGFTQVENLELESIDAMELLEEFEEELAEEETEEPEQSEIELSEFEEELKEELNIEDAPADDTLVDLNLKLEDIEESEEDPLSDLDEFAVDPETQKRAQEQELLEELTVLREKKVDDFIEANKSQLQNESRYTIYQIEALRVQLKDIAASPTKFAYIRKGTKVIGLKDNKAYFLPKGITVKAHSLADANNFRYITNKDNEIAYKVYFSEISNINTVTQMYKKPHSFTRITQKPKSDSFDGKLKTSLKFNLHTGFTVTRFTKDIVPDADDAAPLLRLEGSWLSRFDLPLRVGLTGMYESMTGTIKGGGKFTSKILSFGPTIIKEGFIDQYNFIFMPRISIAGNLTESTSEDSRSYAISDTSVLLGVEKLIHNKNLGTFVLGANFQRKWLRAKGQVGGFDISSNVSYDDSLALSIGHQSDWLW